MTDGPFPDLIDDPLGEVILRDDGRCDLVLRRRIRRPVEKVWAALTVPERIGDWLAQAEVDLELRVGGRYNLRFTDGFGFEGVITELEPLRRLAHTWPDMDPSQPPALVRYELEPEAGGCRLTLTNAGVPAMWARSIAGWHAFLEALPGATEGIRTPWTMAREEEILARYHDRLPATPAEPPS